MMLDKFNDELNKIMNAKSVYIYGAGDVGKEVCFCLSSEAYGINVLAFLVTSISETTPAEIDGVPVMEYNDARVDKDTVVVIAVLEKYKDEICNTLDSVGMTNRVLMTFESDLWSVNRGRLFEQYCNKKGYSYLFGFQEHGEYYDSKRKSLKVYVTRSSKDKPLKNVFLKRDWEEEIQAGASLDTNKCDFVGDDKGANISHKNRVYCELTVMYWAWKNQKSDYVGLSHYRRRFDFKDDDIKKIMNNDLDVVLTMPVINVPNVKFMYGKNHHLEDWDKMVEVVEDVCPEYRDDIEVVEQSNYYIPYNMLIAKKDVFDRYCEWLFPLLERCEQVIGSYDDVYQNRYIGFLSERLMTAYFYHHRDDLKIMFCNKHFLE